MKITSLFDTVLRFVNIISLYISLIKNSRLNRFTFLISNQLRSLVDYTTYPRGMWVVVYVIHHSECAVSRSGFRWRPHVAPRFVSPSRPWRRVTSEPSRCGGRSFNKSSDSFTFRFNVWCGRVVASLLRLLYMCQQNTIVLFGVSCCL